MVENSFFANVYAIVAKIPIGKVTTYGTIARLIGNKRMSRQVGWALHVNPNPNLIPCHRVVNRYGQLSVAFAFGGINRQEQLLEEEGVAIINQRVDLQQYLWEGEVNVREEDGSFAQDT